MDSDDNDLSGVLTDSESKANMSHATNNVDTRDASSDTFPFEKLPAELRLMIIGYAIPQKRRLHFCVMSMSKIELWPQKKESQLQNSIVLRHLRLQLQTYATLLRVKAFQEQAQDTFFKSNELLQLSLECTGFESSTLLSSSHDQQVLRDMSRIRLVLSVYHYGQNACSHFREEIQNLIDGLLKCDSDIKKKSLLKCLEVNMTEHTEHFRDRMRSRRASAYEKEEENIENYMFALEILSELRQLGTVKEVIVTGVPTWFAKCLQRSITGPGREVDKFGQTATWYERFGGEMYGSAAVRPWAQPIYGWATFARINKITIPRNYPKPTNPPGYRRPS